MRFEHSLEIGQAGESAIARWLRGKGYAIMPVYEKIIDTGKGPQIFTVNGSLVAPDMLVFYGRQDAAWVEAKNKDAFTWHRISRRWVTGIDLRHYRDYLTVDDTSPWPVWVLFLQRGGLAKDTPVGIKESSSGLYGATIAELKAKVSHTSMNHGPSGMVYWARDVDGGPLEKWAELRDVLVPEAEAA